MLPVLDAETGGLIALLLGALALGFRHGFDWDHIAAIADITSTAVGAGGPDGATADVSAAPDIPPRDVGDGDLLMQQASLAASGVAAASVRTMTTPALSQRRVLQIRGFYLGTLYALGHASVVALLGLAAYLFGAVLPDWVDPIMGRIVGLTLLALGIWLLFSAYRYVRHGQEFRLRSRWMLVFDGMSNVRRRFLGRHGHDHATTPQQARTYGAGTSYGIGMIHGVGAETATQVLLITALGGAASQGLGLPLMLAFIVGLVAANTVIVIASVTGFGAAGRRQRLYVAIGVVAGIASIAIGAMFLLGSESLLPDLTEILGGSVESLQP